MDGTVVPGQNHLLVLARELSRGRPVSAEDLERDLRRQFALARLAETVAAVVGWEAVSEDVETAFQLAKLMQENDSVSSEIDGFIGLVELVREPGEASAPSDLVEDVVPLLLLMVGSFAPFAPGLLRPLAARPELRGWTDDMRAVALSPELKMQFIARDHSGGRAAAGLAQDYVDVVVAPSPEDLEATEAIRRVLSGQADELFSVNSTVHQIERPAAYYQRAIQVRRRLARRFSENADAHYQLGSMLGRAGARLRNRDLIVEGIMECRVAAGLELRWDAPAVEPGIILTHVGDWDGVLRELDVAEESLPAVTPHLRNVRGYALMNSGRFEKALAEFLAVVEARSDFGSAWGYAARCAFGLGNRTDGLRYAKRAKALGDPVVYDAWEKGAYGHRKKRRAN